MTNDNHRTDHRITAVSTDDIANPPAPVQVTADGIVEEAWSLLPPEDEAEIARRWETIQARFVDEPRRAVQEADKLVAGLMVRLAEALSGERGNLEKHWDRTGQVSTEELRVTLQRYKSFSVRLLRV
jgi:hypothetical protein